MADTPYPSLATIDPQKMTQNMSQTSEHPPLPSTLQDPPGSLCTNRPCSNRTQLKPTTKNTTRRPRHHTSPLHIVAIKTFVVTPEHTTNIAHPPLPVSGSNLLKTRTRHNYSNITDNTEVIGHKAPAAGPTVRGRGSPMGSTCHCGPTSSTHTNIGKTTCPYGIRYYTHREASHQNSKHGLTCPHNNDTSNKIIASITQTSPQRNPYAPRHDQTSLFSVPTKVESRLYLHSPSHRTKTLRQTQTKTFC